MSHLNAAPSPIPISTREPPARPSTDRLLGIAHMAMYRGWLQGMSLREVTDLYLGQGMDLRRSRTVLFWIRDTLHGAALKNGQFGVARLLRTRIVARSMPAPGQTAPGLDEFRDMVDPGDVYDTETLSRLYQERYPNSKKELQRASLLNHQIEALNLMETLLVTDPVLSDATHAWFDRSVADRLAGHGLKTLADLITHIEYKGYHWTRQIQGVGRITADRIVHWLQTNEKTLRRLPERALSPPHEIGRLHRSQVSVRDIVPTADPITGTAIMVPVPVPMEDLFLPRQSQKADAQIQAETDREAIEAWMTARGGSSSTYRAYRKEAERLLLWSRMEGGLTFTSLSVQDCSRYREWLAGLGRTPVDEWDFRIPQQQWIGPKGVQRGDPRWRPFHGPLGVRSVQYAMTVTGAMFAWLTRVGYLGRNPFDALGKVRFDDGNNRSSISVEMIRVLSADQVQAALSASRELDRRHAMPRHEALLRLALTTGMRVSELAAACIGWVYRVDDRDGQPRIMLNVVGKGGKRRPVPLLDDVEILLRHCQPTGRGVNHLLDLDPDNPLIPRSTQRHGTSTMTPAAITQILERIFSVAATQMATAGRQLDASDLRRATPHWIRHTAGKTLSSQGVPVSVIQKLLGHASIATTGIYTDVSGRDIWNAVQKCNSATQKLQDPPGTTP